MNTGAAAENHRNRNGPVAFRDRPQVRSAPAPVHQQVSSFCKRADHLRASLASTAARDTRIAGAVRASMRTGVNTHTRNGNCLCLRRLVPFQRHIPFRRRIVEGMFAATSLVLLWMIILAIDARAGVQLAGAVTRGVSTNGGAVMQVSNSVGHVTRSVWELSYTYGPLMTFGCIAIVLVIVMTRSTR